MRILTVSASPYLLVRNGKMNADLIRSLKAEGHEVVSAVWHHDEGYFLPEMNGLHMYEEDGEDICELHPFVVHPEHASSLLYEIMKKTAPDVVISIGDYKDTDYVYSIKAMYPNLFKWVAIFTTDCLRVNELHKEFIEYADVILSTTKFGSVDLQNLCGRDVEFIPYGPDHSKFFPNRDKDSEDFNLLNTSKNAQVSNLGAFVMAVGRANDIMTFSEDEVNGFLHTNIYDPGEYDVHNLVERYAPEAVKITDEYVSVKEGISDEEMNELYNSHQCIVDCSVKSATALSILEAMSTGCIPIGPDYGRVGEIISEMPLQYQFFVPHEIYIGKDEEEYAVVSVEGLIDRILVLRRKVFPHDELMAEARQAAMDVAAKYSNTSFVNRVAEIVQEVVKTPDVVTVESF